LMVTTRWAGSVGDRPSDEWMRGLRERGRRLLDEATDKYSVARFLAADAFFVFWVQGGSEPTPQELAESEASARRAMEIATELDDAELRSIVLDAMGGFGTAVNDWARARQTAEERISFEDKLGLYERLDAHSAAAGMSYLIGGPETAERGDARLMGVAIEAIESIVSRFPPGFNQSDLIPYIHDDAAFQANDPSLRYGYWPEFAERRFSLAADRRQEIPQVVLDQGLARS